MFDLSLIELLFIAIVGLIVIGPHDLPKVVAYGLRLMRQLKTAITDVRVQLDEMIDDTGIKTTQEEIKTLIDQDGNIQRTYDISDFLDEKASALQPERIEGAQETGQPPHRPEALARDDGR